MEMAGMNDCMNELKKSGLAVLDLTDSFFMSFLFSFSDKNQLRKKASYLSSDEMSPSSLSPSGPPQPKKGFLGFMQRRYRR